MLLHYIGKFEIQIRLKFARGLVKITLWRRWSPRQTGNTSSVSEV